MSSQQFEMAILIAMAILAVGAIGAVASIIRGRRRSWVANLPSTPVHQAPRVSANPVREFPRDDIRTNFGMF